MWSNIISYSHIWERGWSGWKPSSSSTFFQFELFERKFLNSSFSSLSSWWNQANNSLSSNSRQQHLGQQYPLPLLPAGPKDLGTGVRDGPNCASLPLSWGAPTQYSGTIQGKFWWHSEINPVKWHMLLFKHHEIHKKQQHNSAFPHTGTCEKDTPPERETDRKIGFQSTGYLGLF